MLKLDLRRTAEDLDIAIKDFSEVLYILNASEDVTISKEEKEELRGISKKCIALEALRNETDLMIIERSILYYSREQAIDKISAVLEDLKETRGLINV